jgi:hypothetical protein
LEVPDQLLNGSIQATWGGDTDVVAPDDLAVVGAGEAQVALDRVEVLAADRESTCTAVTAE